MVENWHSGKKKEEYGTFPFISAPRVVYSRSSGLPFFYNCTSTRVQYIIIHSKDTMHRNSAKTQHQLLLQYVLYSRVTRDKQIGPIRSSRQEITENSLDMYVRDFT